MKKIIRNLSVISLISTLFFFVIPLVLGFISSLSVLDLLEINSAEKITALLSIVLPSVIGTAVSIVALIFLLKTKNKTSSFAGELVFLVIKFGALPFINWAYSLILVPALSARCTSDVVRYYSAFQLGFNLLSSFDFSSVLLLLALAFSLTEKVWAKKTAQ